MKFRLVLAVAVCLCITAHSASTQRVYTQGTVPGVDACIDLFYSANGILQVNNHCSYTIRALWFFGKSIPAGATLSPQQSVSTGRDHADLDKWGNIRYYACPADHAHFLDANGKGIQDGSVNWYKCAPNGQ